VVVALAKGGADVAIWDIDGPRSKTVASEVENAGRKALKQHVDVRNWHEIEAATKTVIEEFGRIDILIPSVGGSGTTPTYLTHDIEAGRYIYHNEGIRRYWFEQVETEDWDGIIELNLRTVFLTCKAVVPHMKQQRSGSIVTFSSLAEEICSPHSSFAFCAYAAAKAGVSGLTRHLARELGAFGIRVNCAAPGYVNNERMVLRKDLFEKLVEEDKAGGKEVPPAYSMYNPLGRISTIEEQAEAVVFLASDRASFITGVTIDVNGGVYMS
jgi:NAD(P)-dependent dehydrogenase (short-subunit alcohol dehydrogenase family)